MIEYFDFEQLSRTNKVACDFDVRFRRLFLTARMIVLCGASVYVQ
jgi:hypothetical protein